MAAQPHDMAGPRAATPVEDDDQIVLDDAVDAGPVDAGPVDAGDREPVSVGDPESTDTPDASDPDASDPAAGRHRADPDGRLLTDQPVPDDELIPDDELAPEDEPVAGQGPIVAVEETEVVTALPVADSPDTTPAAALAEQQWPAIQSMFVDDPRGAVERAARAAGEVAASFVATVEREQAELRSSWSQDADTEQLRTALQRYRAFCGRLEGLV